MRHKRDKEKGRAMKKHFVTFFSPGTLVEESTTKEIDAWDTDKAVEMAADIMGRHGARPCGFYFTTRERGPQDFDSKETEKSGAYFLGGQVSTLEQLREKNDPRDRILISNMEINRLDRVITTHSPWRWTYPLRESDVVLTLP